MRATRTAARGTQQRSSSSADIIDRCRRIEGSGLRTFVDEHPLVWERAQGSWVEDPEGNRYLDLYAGYAVGNIGYGHPRVVEAISSQAAQLIHCPSAHPSRVRADFLEALASIAPPGLTRVLPAVTGAMANEMALAIARTVRDNGNDGDVITFTGSYFGRAAGVVGLAGKARYREALGEAPAGRFVPFPYPLRMGPKATDQTLGAIEELLDNGAHPYAVMLEPIQGNGGVVIPPEDFLPRLRELCDRIGALMIVDEIQSGFGRTGKTWAVEHSGVTPDLMTIGKGIGGGMGIAAVLGREELMTRWPSDSYTSTFLTNSLNLAAATAAISVFQDQNLSARSRGLGDRALAEVTRLLSNVLFVAEVRGRGLWVAIELVDHEGVRAPELARRAHRRARERGVLVGRGGYDEQVIKLSPALTIEETDLQQGLDVVVNAIEESTREAP